MTGRATLIGHHAEPDFANAIRTEGQAFLAQLADLPCGGFVKRFSKISTSLNLGADLSRNELILLYDAAYEAALCNIALNGLGGCGGRIKPENEANRTRLEREFVEKRALLYSSPGWQKLTGSKKAPVARAFLHIAVTDANLAW